MSEVSQIASLFKSHDKDFIRGGFGHVSEKVVRTWEEDDELVFLCDDVTKEVMVAAHVLEVKNRKKIEDFAGTCVGWAQPGDVHVKRVAWSSDVALFSFMDLLMKAKPETVVWVEEFVEYRGPVLAFRPNLGAVEEVCVKVRGDSTEMGIYALARERATISSRIKSRTKMVDELTLERLDISVPEAQITALVRAMKREGLEWADHYSHYNVAHTWKAVTLRGYGGRADFIAKPSEMSKKWKEENPEKLAWEIEDTSIRPNFPEAEPLIDLIPGVKHRIRLMLLKAGSELLRHSDITDPDAGTGDGKLLRIHIPLVTNPECMVLQWRLDGSLKSENLKVGEAWYLDTRKPHAVRNGGKADRIHLVMDVESNPELRRLLGVEEDQKTKLEAWI